MTLIDCLNILIEWEWRGRYRIPLESSWESPSMDLLGVGEKDKAFRTICSHDAITRPEESLKMWEVKGVLPRNEVVWGRGDRSRTIDSHKRSVFTLIRAEISTKGILYSLESVRPSEWDGKDWWDEEDKGLTKIGYNSRSLIITFIANEKTRRSLSCFVLQIDHPWLISPSFLLPSVISRWIEGHMQEIPLNQLDILLHKQSRMESYQSGMRRRLPRWNERGNEYLKCWFNENFHLNFFSIQKESTHSSSSFRVCK